MTREPAAGEAPFIQERAPVRRCECGHEEREHYLTGTRRCLHAAGGCPCKRYREEPPRP